MLSVLVLYTTANFPGVMMPAYVVNHGYASFFISYLFIALYFVHAVLFASIYQNYYSSLKKDYLLTKRRKRAALKAAFELLDGERPSERRGFLDEEQWGLLISMIQPDVGEEHITALFEIATMRLNGNATQQMTLKDFMSLDSLLRISLKPTGVTYSVRSREDLPEHLYAPDSVPRSGHLLGFGWLRSKKRIRILVNVIIACSTLLIIYHAREMHMVQRYGNPNAAGDKLSRSFEVNAILEHIGIDLALNFLLLLRICNQGAKTFFRSKWNCFDAGATLLPLVLGVCLATWIVQVQVSQDVGEDDDTVAKRLQILRYALLAYCTRVLRLIASFKTWRHYSQYFVEVFYSSGFIAILGTFFYVFSVVGWQIFGGVVYAGQERLLGARMDCELSSYVEIASYKDRVYQPQHKCVQPPLVQEFETGSECIVKLCDLERRNCNATHYGKGKFRAPALNWHCGIKEVESLQNEDYYENNFNSMAESFVTVFELIVQNDWQLAMLGTTRASGTLWSLVYFLTIYIVGVIVVLNLFASIVVEYHQQRETRKEEREASKRGVASPSAQLTLRQSMSASVMRAAGKLPSTTNGGPLDEEVVDIDDANALAPTRKRAQSYIATERKLRTFIDISASSGGGLAGEVQRDKQDTFWDQIIGADAQDAAFRNGEEEMIDEEAMDWITNMLPDVQNDFYGKVDGPYDLMGPERGFF